LAVVHLCHSVWWVVELEHRSYFLRFSKSLWGRCIFDRGNIVGICLDYIPATHSHVQHRPTFLAVGEVII